MAAINVLQMTDDEIQATTNLALIRAMDDVAQYNLVWSPPYIAEAKVEPGHEILAGMHRYAVESAVCLVHNSVIGALETDKSASARMVAYVSCRDAKHLVSKLGCTTISSPVFVAPDETNIHQYPLAVGFIGFREDFFYQHPNETRFHVDVAYQYNRDIADVNAGVRYLERNKLRLAGL